MANISTKRTAIIYDLCLNKLWYSQFHCWISHSHQPQDKTGPVHFTRIKDITRYIMVTACDRRNESRDSGEQLVSMVMKLEFLNQERNCSLPKGLSVYQNSRFCSTISALPIASNTNCNT